MRSKHLRARNVDVIDLQFMHYQELQCSQVLVLIPVGVYDLNEYLDPHD
jgi:hypothetical protein